MVLPNPNTPPPPLIINGIAGVPKPLQGLASNEIPPPPSGLRLEMGENMHGRFL